MYYYLVEDQIFTDEETANLYAKERTLAKEFSGSMQTHVGVKKRKVNNQTSEELYNKIKKMTEQWPEEAKERLEEELQSYMTV